MNSWIGSALVAVFIAHIYLWTLLFNRNYHNGYLDGQCSKTRCATGRATVVENKVVCVNIPP